MSEERKQFAYGGSADLVSLAARKEGKEDEKLLAITVKLGFKAPARDVLPFLETSGFLEEFLFLSDGTIRDIALQPIAWSRQLLHYRLTIQGIEATEVTVSKFVAEPHKDRVVYLTFNASWKPPGRDVAVISEAIGEMVDIDLTPLNTELPF